MLKKALMICMLLALGATAATAQKFGHLDSSALMAEMPQTVAADSSISGQAKALEAELLKMETEYNKKVQEYQGLPEGTPQTVLQSRAQEIQNIQLSMQEFAQNADQAINEERQRLYQPIIDQVKTAIETVGKENGFTYIFDTVTQTILYEGGEDVTPLVKAKLGIN